MKNFYYDIYTDNLTFYIQQALRDYFTNKTSANDILNLSFDGCVITEDINFKEQLVQICNENSNDINFRLFKKYLNNVVKVISYLCHLTKQPLIFIQILTI